MDVTSAVEWGNGEVVYLRFEVKDSGCGLKPEEKKKLFNRFSQASPRTHVQYGGSGLGLFISRQLTELQGGEIGVASKEGEGSTFAFYIKARRTDTTEDERKSALKRRSWDVQSNTSTTPDSLDSLDSQEHHDKHTSALLALSEIPAINPNNWHILIVEDNLVNQRILAQQIRKLGATVYIANHGGEALSVIQESKYYTGREHDGKELSVILMDLEMPVMDGLTCVRRIREMEQEGLVRARLPIIAVTANARDEQIGMARDSGMDDVMPKPFRIVQIKAKIEALLRKMVDST
jgi:CheY-like chemotaxis protein